VKKFTIKNPYPPIKDSSRSPIKFVSKIADKFDLQRGAIGTAVGGALFGPLGALVGGLIGRRRQKKKDETALDEKILTEDQISKKKKT